MKRPIFFALVISLLGLPAGAEETVRISAGAAPLENIFKKIQEPFQAATGVKMIATKATHVTSLEEVDQGKADVATVGIAFEEWLKRAEKDGLKLSGQKSDFKFRVIGKDNIVFIAHKDLPVSKLSEGQLRDIFTGKEKSWKAFGGPDIPIAPVTGDKLPAFTALVKERVLKGGEMGKNVKVLPGDIPVVKAYVQGDPGAFGFVPSGAVDSTVKAVEGPEIGRPVTAVTKGVPSPTVLKLFEFLAKEGPKYVK